MRKYIGFGLLVFAKFLTVALLIMDCNIAHATSGKIEVRGSTDDGTTTLTDSGLITKYFTNDVVQVQVVTATASSFTNLTVPTNAKAVMIDVGSVRALKLKGVTGDVGISLDSTCPVVLPISRDSTVTLGIQNLTATSETVKVYFF